MGNKRTAWHWLFGRALIERHPPGFEVRPEVPLGSEPQRVDLLLLRRGGAERRDAEARILKDMWPLIERDAIVEFKSASRPLRPGDLLRLVGYGAQYHAGEVGRLGRTQLALLLVVPRRTGVLGDELARLGWRVTTHATGYDAIEGSPWPAYVVALDAVSAVERDELLAFLATGDSTSKALGGWVLARMHGELPEAEMSELEGYDEVVEAFLRKLPVEKRLAGLRAEERLAGLRAEERLAGLRAEERLAGLSPEEQLLALSDEVLRALPDTFLETLPPEILARIRERLSH